MRGYFGIGIERTKTAPNVGTLWRSADLFGAAFMFTIGRRYSRENSDTMKSWKGIPLFHYQTIDELQTPMSCPIVGIELTDKSEAVEDFVHPERCIYLLGAEDHGLTRAALSRCHKLIQLPGRRSMNVAAAGTVVLYDRYLKSKKMVLK